MIGSLAEKQISSSIADELRSRGYQVYPQPTSNLLPSFFRDSYQPDLIALRASGNLAIEIASRSSLKEKKIERIAALFQKNPDWNFKVYWIDELTEDSYLPQLSSPAISLKLAEAKNLIQSRHTEAAFLLTWASFEAIARSEMPARFKKPQSPGRVVQVLATEGYITPSESDRLQTYIQKRNALIHGDLSIQISQSDAKDMLSIVEALLPKQAA